MAEQPTRLKNLITHPDFQPTIQLLRSLQKIELPLPHEDNYTAARKCLIIYKQTKGAVVKGVLMSLMIYTKQVMVWLLFT